MKILLPIDGSYHTDIVVQSVLNEPWPTGSTFRLLAVAEPQFKIADSIMGSAGKMAANAQHALVEDIKISLTEAAGKLKEKFGQDKVIEIFREGTAPEQILDVCNSWKSDLIIMGAHGTGGYNDNTLGSVCLKVISHSPCSVRIVHDFTSRSLQKKLSAHAPISISRVLLAINESINSQVAIDAVLNRSWLPDTLVQILTVVHEKNKATHSRFFQAPEIIENEKNLYAYQKAEAAQLIKEATIKLENKFGKGKVTAHVLEGNVRSLILQIAQDWAADIIIMGAHENHKTVLEYFVGSVTTAVVSNAACSVELIRMSSP